MEVGTNTNPFRLHPGCKDIKLYLFCHVSTNSTCQSKLWPCHKSKLSSPPSEIKVKSRNVGLHSNFHYAWTVTDGFDGDKNRGDYFDKIWVRFLYFLRRVRVTERLIFNLGLFLFVTPKISVCDLLMNHLHPLLPSPLPLVVVIVPGPDKDPVKSTTIITTIIYNVKFSSSF